jgi:hypothetical protein
LLREAFGGFFLLQTWCLILDLMMWDLVMPMDLIFEGFFSSVITEIVGKKLEPNIE